MPVSSSLLLMTAAPIFTICFIIQKMQRISETVWPICFLDVFRHSPPEIRRILSVHWSKKRSVMTATTIQSKISTKTWMKWLSRILKIRNHSPLTKQKLNTSLQKAVSKKKNWKHSIRSTIPLPESTVHSLPPILQTSKNSRSKLRTSPFR